MTISRQIEHEENLGRGVFSSGHAKRARRAKIPVHVFLEREGVAEISVDRLDRAPLADAVAIADINAAARRAKFYGWAVILARQASGSRREVRASPKLDNPYHADIVLPDSASEDRDEQISHAQDLADSSSWRERPANQQP